MRNYRGTTLCFFHFRLMCLEAPWLLYWLGAPSYSRWLSLAYRKGTPQPTCGLKVSFGPLLPDVYMMIILPSANLYEPSSDRSLHSNVYTVCDSASDIISIYFRLYLHGRCICREGVQWCDKAHLGNCIPVSIARINTEVFSSYIVYIWKAKNHILNLSTTCNAYSRFPTTRRELSSTASLGNMNFGLACFNPSPTGTNLRG